MRTSTRIWLAIGAMVPMFLVLLLPLSLAAMTFLQDRMHLYCGFARMGADDPGSWYCSDGIGYILPGVITGFWVGVLLLAVALATAILLPRPLLASRVLAVVAIAGLGFTVATSLVADSGRSPTDDAPPDTWTSVMTVPSVLFAVASVALVLVAFSRDRQRARRGLWVALAVVAAATVGEPALSFGTAPAIIAVGAALVLSYIHVPASMTQQRELSAARR